MELTEELCQGGAKEAVEEFMRWLQRVRDEIGKMLDEEVARKRELEKMPVTRLMGERGRRGGSGEGEGGCGWIAVGQPAAELAVLMFIQFVRTITI